MALANQVSCPVDKSLVVLPGEDYPLVAPELFQSVNSDKVLPETVRANDVLLHDLHAATVWFDGVKTHIVNSVGETIYNYGNMPFDSTNLPGPEYLEGTTLLLGIHGAHNYYHWNVDVLPKLGILELAGYSLDDVDRIVLRDFNQKFHHDAFARLGIAEEKLYLTENAPYFRCQRLLHVDLRNFVGMQMNRVVPDYLRSVFLEKPQSVRGRKLFIARANNHARPITNQDKALELVGRYGYETVYMEGLTLAEQAEMFNSASVIVGTHGAGLTNLVYCEPGTTVVEIYGEHVYSFFYGLSNLCGLRYIPILSSPDDYDAVVDANIGNAKTDQAKTIKAPTTVNLEALEKALAAL